MARSIGGNHARGSGEPPSTLAAQIVQNLENVARRPASTDAKGHLKELLHLILEDAEERTSTQRNSEDTIEENRRLIIVIVRACLKPVLQHDPFEDESTLRSEAKQCLAVISTTVRRCPESLFAPSTREAAASHPRGPMYLWLIPKLVSVLASTDWPDVQEDTIQLLRTSIKVEARALSLRLGLRPVSRLLQGCVNDLLLRIARVEDRIETADPDRVPSQQTINNAGIESLDLVRDTSALTYRNTIQDHSYVIYILSAFTDSHNAHVASSQTRLGSSSVIEPGWLIECITTWLAFPTGRGVLSSRREPTICILLLGVLRDAVLQSRTAVDGTICLEAAAMSFKIMSQLLLSPNTASCNELDAALCQLIACLVSVCHESKEVLQIYVEDSDQSFQTLLLDQEKRGSMSADLQRALMLMSQLALGDGTAMMDELMNFDDLELREVFERSLTIRGNASFDEHEANGRPNKRIRLSDSESTSGASDRLLVEKLHQLPGFSPGGSSYRPNRLRQSFSTLAEDAQCKLLEDLGLAACANAKSLIAPKICTVCDNKTPPAIRGSPIDERLLQTLHASLAELSQQLQEQKAPRPRVAAMLALSRLLAHSDTKEHFDIRESAMGQWCCQSLKSSVRDFRLAALNALEWYLSGTIVTETLRQNRLTCLDCLRSIADRNDWNLQETCVLGFGQIGRQTIEEDERNIVLLRLVEYLGHLSPFISSLAFEELSKLASSESATARQLFEPYWRTVAVLVVKNLQTRPQIAQSICDLLGIHVTELLQRTQFWTIPYMVYKGNLDILQRIAKANGAEETTHSLCYQHGQLAAILSFLLLQPSEDPERLVAESMARVSERFAALTLPDLLKCDTMYMAYELLKIAGEHDSSSAPQAKQVLQYLAEVFHHRPKASKSSELWKEEARGAFFDSWALAIVQLLSETITEAKGPQAVFERRRCVGALTEMARLAQHRLSNALPQVRSCLQFAIEDKRLRNEAFTAWLVLLETLDAQDIQMLVDQTLALLVQHWDSLEAETQTKAYDAISELLKQHHEMVLDMIETLPSLAHVPLLSKFEAELKRLKNKVDEKRQFAAFARRCQSESIAVVSVALVELQPFLVTHQAFLQSSAISEEPDPIVGSLMRSLLDACVRFKEVSDEIAVSCARCLGLIGCIDPSRVEASREESYMLVLSNFAVGTETVDFVLFFLQEVLVKVYLTSTITTRQQILAFGMQELLKLCDMTSSVTFKRGIDEQYKKWISLKEPTRNVLTPFLTSKYVINAPALLPERQYPIYERRMKHNRWVHDFTLDLLQKGQGENATLVFSICRRLVRNQDVSIANFLLPYALLNVVVEGTDQDFSDIAIELETILAMPLHSLLDASGKQNLIHCSQNVFRVIDYLSRWTQEKRKLISAPRARGTSKEQRGAEPQFQRIDALIRRIPAEVMSTRAVDCKNYSRALFYWEQHIREQRTKGSDGLEDLYERLQDIYTQIDEPDGIEGISSYLQNISFEQQLVADRNAGRWNSVQSWYEIKMTERPNDISNQLALATSLKETGQHIALLNLVSELSLERTPNMHIVSLGLEAAWSVGKWDALIQWTENAKIASKTSTDDFNIALGDALCSLYRNDFESLEVKMRELLLDSARPLTLASTATLQACHRPLLRFHTLVEMEMICGLYEVRPDRATFDASLDRRLEMMGTFPADQAFLLGLRRAVMQITPPDMSIRPKGYSDRDTSTTWLRDAKIARKAGHLQHALGAVLRAQELNDPSAPIEYARLMWGAGHHRKAMQTLEAAIESNAFRAADVFADEAQSGSRPSNASTVKNSVSARAHLLLARWIDRAGQSQSIATVQRYRDAISLNTHWEKSHVQLGKHYNKLLESEKANPPSKQAQTYITGEMAKLVIENFVRSLPYGTKYIYQTLPKLLTLWMDLGAEIEKPIDHRIGDQNFRDHTQNQRKKIFQAIQTGTFKKYIERLPGFVLYTAFAQIVARITHPNKDVAERLVDFVVKVVLSHPQQALWPILAMMKSRTSPERAKRGAECKVKLLERAKAKSSESIRTDFPIREIPQLLASGQRLTDQLVDVCNKPVEKDLKNPVSLAHNLGFNHKRAVPSRLAIPIEATLLAKLPPANSLVKDHRAFSKDTITISAFLDEASVLNSLAKPRRVKIRGSDGKTYSLLCKPKDDLRKDQRLLEFNSMISRILKRDAECSRRRLYIKTYAVTPLNEECGLIEWVDGMKTLREILLNSYRQMGTQIDYEAIRTKMTAVAADPKQIEKFTVEVLSQFPPVLHDWFVDQFPEPDVWFNARLRYTRSCAVMSMIGHVLGLGDRHGENILLEETQGGTFHVDFNCLFDKGKTFETPERVPFRLTHNMVDAFGAYGENGPYRRSCELTLSMLRQNEDTLMTILETFLYDPTADFLGKKKPRHHSEVPDTPEGVLESVRNKVRGLLPMESVPLSVEGYVQLLIEQATDPYNLARMYIGWCPFL